MSIDFTTHDQLYKPPPPKLPSQKPPPRNKSWFWALFLVLLISAMAGIWRGRLNWTPVERPSSADKTASLSPEATSLLAPEILASQPDPEPIRIDIPPIPALAPKEDLPPEDLPNVNADIVEGVPLPADEPFRTPESAEEEPAAEKTGEIAAVPIIRAESIRLNLEKKADALRMTLGVPRDERSQTLESAALASADIDVQVVHPDGNIREIGRARVLEWVDSGPNPTAILEFTEMPAFDAQLTLVNARFTDGTKLSLVLDGAGKLEYELTIMNTRALDSGR